MMHMTLRLAAAVLSLVVGSTLVGCASTSIDELGLGRQMIKDRETAEAAAKQRNSDEKKPSKAQTKRLDVSPLHGSEDFWKGPTAAGASFAGAYTRLVIKSTFMDSKSKDGETDKLSYDQRSPVWRALVGKEFNVVASAKMKIPNVLDISVPLVIVGHSSNSTGESWIREVYFERRDFPLFLVKRTGEASTPSVTAEIKGTSSIASRGVAAGVSALNRLSSVAGASPALITTLNKDATKEAADKIDAEISKLLSTSVTERSSWDRPLSNWVATDRNTSGGGIEITFKLPKEGDWNTADLLGSWMVTFAPPRPSIFSDWHVCSGESAEDAKKLRCSPTIAEALSNLKMEVQPSEILNYKLLTGPSNLGSVHSFIKSKEWYSAGTLAMAKLNNTDPKTFNLTAASEFCRNVVNEVTGLDLAQTDAGLVLWALYKAGRPEFSDLEKSPDCSDLMNWGSMQRRS
jgi:hypothetical protein